MEEQARTTAPPQETHSAESLIKELNNKLKELDHKVLLYRRDMAKQFSRLKEERLREEPEEVRLLVNEAVRERFGKSSLADIPEDAVVQGVDGTADLADLAGRLEITEVGGQIANEISREMTQEVREGKRPAPVAIVKVDGEDDVPRSPHARENEFLGVFTQGYLPLLDSNKQHERRSGSSISSKGEGSTALPIRRPQSLEEPQSQGLSVSYSPPRSGTHPHKPDHQRRHTGDAASLSDPEGHKPRRSALRRSSSSGKAHSLRRVRFEFAGVEFPTTSSPSVAETRLSGAAAADMPVSSLSSTITADEDSDAPESEQVEFIEDIEDEEVVPKRISSSQALRMLSRGPIEDDGTQWEEVVAPADGSPSIAVEQANLDSDDEDVLSLGLKRSRSDEKKSPSPPQAPVTSQAEDNAKEDAEQEEEISPEEKAEEDDILADMAPLAPMHSTRGVMGNNAATVTTTTTFIPFTPGHPIAIPVSETIAAHQPLHDMSPVASTTATNIPSSGSLTALPRKKGKAKAFILPDDSDDDELPFEFEDNSGASTPRRSQRPPSPIEDEDEDSDTSSESPMSPERGVPPGLSMYASSPARDIAGSQGMGVDVVSPTTRNTFNNSGLAGAGSLTGAGTSSASAQNEGPGSENRTPSSSLPHREITPPQGSLRDRANVMGHAGGSSLRNSYGAPYAFPPHPFQVPVVDMEVNEQARHWGEERSFVGSVSGRTGLDEWDGVGYAGSLRGVPGGGRGAGRDIPAGAAGEGRGRGGSVMGSGSGAGGSLTRERPMSFSQRLEEEEKAGEWGRERGRGAGDGGR